MNKCDVCGNTTFRPQQVDEVFRIGDQFLMVEGIPARVCERCGDATFDRQTAESIRHMAHAEHHPTRRMSVDVLAFA